MTAKTRSARLRESAGAGVLNHLRRLIHAIHAQSTAIEGAVGLTGPQLWALREVAAREEGLSLGELARALVLHPANAGRLVERLDAKRLVRRERSEEDRRVVIVRATAAGQKLARGPVPAPAQVNLLHVLEALPATELGRIERALAKLVELAGASDVEPGPLFEEKKGARGAR